MPNITQLDQEFVWHPFTPTDSWLAAGFKPIVITEAEGSWLQDESGKRYLDGNSSIWTNLHGHRHPQLAHALHDQIDRISHSSFLGLTNDVAPQLAEKLCRLANLDRCFFSDDGSTAMEASLKMLWQFYQQNGQPQRQRFISLSSGYHGDTIGAMSLSHSPTFHQTYKPLLFSTEEVMTPYCYRCPYNQARPEKTDARKTRRCHWECLDHVEKCFAKNSETAAAWVIEPRVQGAAGFIMQPETYLEKTCNVAQGHGAKVILDEVMTGFHRTGPLFSFQNEDVKPDFIALAKGLTSGTMPLAATLTTKEIFDGFRGDRSRTFFHGHSYTGNQLGCSVSLASLALLQEDNFAPEHEQRIQNLRHLSQRFWQLDCVGDVRQEGFICAIELVKDFSTRQPYDPALRLGALVCQQATLYGLITRPVGDVLVLMPPYSTSLSELEKMVDALYKAIEEVILSL